MTILVAAACQETFESRFDNHAALERSSSSRGDWIPKWVPSSARDIYERHNIDTNASLLRFSYGSPDEPPFGSACKPTATHCGRGSHLSADWWPDDLGSERAPSDRYQLFECAEESGCLAVVKSEKEAFFWRP
jgi:hypothetical protein